jgi:phosphoserine aminotransferase
VTRVFNFSAGPAMLPAEVLEQAQNELPDFANIGMSVMELSHRGKEFLGVAQQAEADLRELLNIPNNYKVLFLQGGASSQFAMIPLNLLNGKKTADYLNTGMWSKKAIAEAKRYCDVNIVASSENEKFTTIPDVTTWQLNSDAAYLHYTPNETIGGVEFQDIPNSSVPIIADMSSTLLSRPINVSKFGMIYAGAQKNIGPAGLTIVIIREDLVGNATENTPAMFNYTTHVKTDSMYNTPPTFAWYMAGLVFKWLKNKGGLAGMAEINQRKAKLLYDTIDTSSFYNNPVNKMYRSWMNVPFTLANSELDKTFLEAASEIGLKTLKGHRSIGGMRASIYNAMPEEGIKTLVEFMQDFEKTYA